MTKCISELGGEKMLEVISTEGIQCYCNIDRILNIPTSLLLQLYFLVICITLIHMKI